MSFRDAPTTLKQWVDGRRESGFSNFQFVDANFGANPILRRVFSLARKSGFQSLLVERVEQNGCALLAEENHALAIRHPTFSGSEVTRLSFFSSPPDSPKPEGFLGYAVVKEDVIGDEKRTHVYEAVLPPPRSSRENNFIHCARRYRIHTIHGEFDVAGVLYAQQNDATFVCAHVALRTALANLLPDGDVAYAAINRLAGVDHQTTRVGDGAGLAPAQIDAVLTGLGIHYRKVSHEPTQKLILPIEYQRELYGYIESGCACLVGFELAAPVGSTQGASRHMIPVIGHTFNEDAWVPEAQRMYFGSNLGYLPSENWLSSYVIHDDNVGPYYCLPRHYLQQKNFRVIYGLLKERTETSPSEAEAISVAYLAAIADGVASPGTVWYDRFVLFRKFGSLILRTHLMTRDTYCDHLRSSTTWQGERMDATQLDRIQSALPPTFWMTEVSIPELFSSTRRKLGEILLDAQTPPPSPLTLDLMIATRLPGLLIIRENGVLNIHGSPIRDHTDLCSVSQQVE